MKGILLAAAVVAAPFVFVSSAQAGIASGQRGNLSWKAQNTIVGVNSTATVVGGGDPAYFANNPKYSGVVTLIMQYDDGAAFICTGSLISGNSIATAGHCVSDGYGKGGTPARVRAYFSDSTDPDFVRFNPADDFNANVGAVAIDVSHIYVNPGYTGEVIDQNDIAVLRLAAPAPDYAKVYGLYANGDVTGEQFNVVGNGRRSSAGGNVGADLGTGRMRQGENIYDYAWGNSDFGGFFTDLDGNGENFFGTAQIDYSFISDLDNGKVANDTACLIAYAVSGLTNYCQQGIGNMEVGIAGGDSGGPAFVDGRLASINSYGLSFGSDWGDIDDALNSSFGEFSGYVPIYIHTAWIGGVVPEPATWAMMIAGFGLVGGAMRRRRAVAAA